MISHIWYSQPKKSCSPFALTWASMVANFPGVILPICLFIQSVVARSACVSSQLFSGVPQGSVLGLLLFCSIHFSHRYMQHVHFIYIRGFLVCLLDVAFLPDLFVLSVPTTSPSFGLALWTWGAWFSFSVLRHEKIVYQSLISVFQETGCFVEFSCSWIIALVFSYISLITQCLILQIIVIVT